MADSTVVSHDNLVMAFEVKPLGVRGRIVRLGEVVDDILHKHDYPAPVSALLAEAVALTAMLGSSLKFDGKFILQTRSDGPVDLIVADFQSPGGVRGYARFNRDRLAALGATPSQQQLLGKGHLAMTVDQGPDMERYQGIVALDGTDLTAAAHTYFAQSEQIPTRLRLAAGPVFTRGHKGESWRAGAIMVQHLPRHGGSSPLPQHSGDAPSPDQPPAEHDDWVKARLLLDTAEAHEMLDPLLTPEQLLYRLYHEDGVTVYPAVTLSRHCTCSRDAVEAMLIRFSPEDRADMVENGAIGVTCEFCSTRYDFDPADIERRALDRPADRDENSSA